MPIEKQQILQLFEFFYINFYTIEMIKLEPYTCCCTLDYSVFTQQTVTYFLKSP